MLDPRALGLKYQVLIWVSIFLGLFVLEYEPIFLVGYWSWSALAHKALTGVLLAVNLVVAQMLARRLGLFRGGS